MTMVRLLKLEILRQGKGSDYKNLHTKYKESVRHITLGGNIKGHLAFRRRRLKPYSI